MKTHQTCRGYEYLNWSCLQSEPVKRLYTHTHSIHTKYPGWDLLGLINSEFTLQHWVCSTHFVQQPSGQQHNSSCFNVIFWSHKLNGKMINQIKAIYWALNCPTVKPETSQSKMGLDVSIEHHVLQVTNVLVELWLKCKTCVHQCCLVTKAFLRVHRPTPTKCFFISGHVWKREICETTKTTVNKQNALKHINVHLFKQKKKKSVHKLPNVKPQLLLTWCEQKRSISSELMCFISVPLTPLQCSPLVFTCV